MLHFKKSLIILGVFTILGHPAGCERNYMSEILSIDLTSESPEIFEAFLDVSRIRRGVFGVSGNMTFGEDLGSETIVSGDIYYSYLGGTFIRTPYFIPKMPLPVFMNTFYKDMLLENLLTCSTNTPDLKYRGIVTKRYVEIKNCTISTENLPSHLKSGFYKTLFGFTGQFKAMLEVITKIEPDY